MIHVYIFKISICCFCLIEPADGKEMLVDTKRAQNLGILFCGLKPESLTRMTDALNSTTEVDTFPADKMTTLKR